MSGESIQDFAASAYAKPNISVVANGASQAELSKWVSEFFTDVPSSSSKAISTEATKYYGGEERIAHGSGNSLVIAFPGSSSFTAGGAYKPEIAVLAALLGGQSSIKWTTGFSLLSKASSSFPGARASTTHFSYSDAGLLTIQFSGSAEAIRGASIEAVKTLKSIAEGSINTEDFRKAVALAKYRALEEGQNLEAGLVSTGTGLIHGGKPFQIDEVGKSVEGVSSDKLKTVRILHFLGILFDGYTNDYVGCKGSSGWQGNCFSGWRSLCIAIRRRNWSQGIGYVIRVRVRVGRPLYQEILECTVDIYEIVATKKFITTLARCILDSP